MAPVANVAPGLGELDNSPLIRLSRHVFETASNLSLADECEWEEVGDGCHQAYIALTENILVEWYFILDAHKFIATR